MDRTSAVATVPTAVDVPGPAYVSNSSDIPAAASVPAIVGGPAV